MGRPPRRYAQGIYHVAGHGSDDRVLFKDDDRRAFLDHLETTFALLGLGIVSYVLMTNHHHLLVHTPTPGSRTAYAHSTAATRESTIVATAAPRTSSAPTLSPAESRTTPTSSGLTATSPATP
jgi:REP element-mobilizing transposase RayT